MYITVAGIKRSGTTWLANLIRIICEERGLSVWMGEHYSLEEKEGFDVTLNKIHPYNDPIARRSDFVFTSWRPLYGIRKSWRRFSGKDLKMIETEQWLTWILLWQMHTNYLMPYTAIKENPLQVVADICAILFNEEGTTVALGEQVLERMEKEVVPPKDKLYDPKTCLFHNHITSE